jgi:hypothetical protein
VRYIVGVRMRRQKEVNSSVLGSRARWFESVPERSNAKDPSIHVNHFYCVWLGPRNECIVVQQQSRLEYPHELAARHRFWHRDRYGQGIRGKVAILD